MTDAPLIPGDDSVLPFQLDVPGIRGRAARLDGTLQRMLEGHDYPPVVAGLAAEIALVTALLGQAMKLRWRLSLQVRGDGPIRLLATDWFAPVAEGQPAHIRAYAGYDPERLDLLAPAFPQIGKGVFGMIIDQGHGMQPYQGITPLSGDSLASCAETYFAQSEQIATRITVAMSESEGADGRRHWRGGGVMLQQMPKPGMSHVGGGGSGEDGLLSAADVAAMGGEDQVENWSRANLLLDTVSVGELIGPEVSPESLLTRLFHEEQPRVWPAQPVRFGCTCSAEKVVEALHQYSAKDIGTMTNEDGKLTADCQFCGKHYEFDPSTLGFEADQDKGEDGAAG